MPANVREPSAFGADNTAGAEAKYEEDSMVVMLNSYKRLRLTEKKLWNA
jgi:hypothetical protein